jgi:uncharacterized protein
MARKDQNPSKETSNRGFASMDPEQQRMIARKGGEAVSHDRQHMASIGRKGGEAVSNNREHMAAIGRKGGQVVSENREHMAMIGRKGGENSGYSRSLKSQAKNNNNTGSPMDGN